MYRLTFAVFVILQVAPIYDAKPRGEIDEMPDKCRGKKFCFTKAEHYPEKKIASLLKDVDELFVDKGDEGVYSKSKYEINSCETRVSVQPIYEIIDQNGDLRYVAQSEKFQQFIRIEECLNPGRVFETTLHIGNMELYQLYLACVQLYMEYSFVVLSQDQKYLETVYVKGGLPISCNCQQEE